MEVLDKGQLGLLSMMGNDETIARAAWVSYAKQDREYTDEQGAKLINFLAKHRHGTPFEHVVYQFYVKAPIFVAREWFRHRIGSFNEVSGRYKTFEPEFYIPEQVRVKGSTNKQGSVVPDQYWLNSHPWSNVETFNRTIKRDLTDASQEAYTTYQEMLEQGVANEIARIILPLNLYTEYWWTVNLRSLLNFVSLRSETTAQWEIQEYSRAIEEIIKENNPIAYEAFINNGRIAP